MSDWLPAIVTSGLVTVFGGIAANAWKLSVEKSIGLAFDGKLEKIRSDLRIEEEKLRADLRQKEMEIESIRKGALAAMNSRHVSLDKRRLEAAERLWAAVVQRSHLKGATTFGQIAKIDVMFERVAKGGTGAEGIIKFASIMEESVQFDKLKTYPNVATERPFISTEVWALFSVYMSVLTYPAVQLMFLSKGLDGKLMESPDKLLELVKKALPHQAEFIEKTGPSAPNYLVEELESKLLGAIVSSLEGREIDGLGVKQANEILKMADALNLNKDKMPDMPVGIQV